MGEKNSRIGVIYPSDGVLDFEFWRCVPPGVSVHVTRVPSSVEMASSLAQSARHVIMAESTDLDEAAKTFSLIDAGSVAYACTAASFTRGVGYDTDIISRIEAGSGAPATTTSTAAVAALRALGVTKLAVAAPYEDEVCERLRRFMSDSGFDVVSLKHLGLSGMDIGEVSDDGVHALGVGAMVPEADALFISCTGLRTIEVLDALENDLGRPVVSANQATMWHALRIGGIDATLDGLGQLYRL
jgi:maleate isomerase